MFPEYYIKTVNNLNNVAKDPLNEWIYYFINNSWPPRFAAKGLDKVEAQLKVDDMTTQEKMNYEANLKNLAVSHSMLETAKLEGITEGELQGRLEGDHRGKIYRSKNEPAGFCNGTHSEINRLEY